MNSIYRYQTEGTKGKKVIIFGFGRRERTFALRLLSERIRFDFFLAPCPCDSFEMPCILNKPVISMEECRELSDYVIVAPYSESDRVKKYLQKHAMGEVFVQLEFLAPSISNASNIVVYGTGGRSERVYNDVGSFLAITHYCDSNKNKAGTVLRGKEVIHPSELKKLSKDTVIIIASTAYGEIIQILRDYHVTEECIFAVEYGIVVHDSATRYFTIHEMFFQYLLRDITNKKIIVYGQERWVEDWLEILDLIDIEEREVIKRLPIEEDGTIYQLAYCGDAIILLADEWSVQMQEALSDLKIEPEKIVFPKDYSSYALPDWLSQSRGERYHLDPTIGQVILRKDEEISGFLQYQYCSESVEAIKILTLGGSTTTGYVTKHRPWSYFLSELLREKKIPHIVYCAGVPGYIASQELLRLLRDGIWLNPDIVLSYSGANNMLQGEVSSKNPFLHSYQEMLFSKLDGSMVANDNIYGNHYGVYYGINSEKDAFEFWRIQLKMMYAVCKEMGIQYKAFLQPVLLSKKQYGKKDADILYQIYTTLWDRKQKKLNNYSPESSQWGQYVQKITDEIRHFRREGEKVKENWFIDLSWIFDDKDGLYIDQYHVNERANKIIAENILEHIKLNKGGV